MILIVDFGSQVTQLIARRIRELNVYCEIIPWDKDVAGTISLKKATAIILSGGPDSTMVKRSPTISKKVFKFDIPLLGICYGHQLICKLLGGKISKSEKREFGKTIIHRNIKNQSPFLKNLFKKNTEEVWMSHGDKVSILPKNFVSLASSDSSNHSIVADLKKNFFGVQFHPEVFHTKNGSLFFKNFLNLAKIKPNWTPYKITEKIISELKRKLKYLLVMYLFKWMTT